MAESIEAEQARAQKWFFEHAADLQGFGATFVGSDGRATPLGPAPRPEQIAVKIGTGLLKEMLKPGAGAFWAGWLVGDIAAAKLKLKFLPSVLLPSLCGLAAVKAWRLAEDVHKLAVMAPDPEKLLFHGTVSCPGHRAAGFNPTAFCGEDDLVTPEAELHAPRKV